MGLSVFNVIFSKKNQFYYYQYGLRNVLFMSDVTDSEITGTRK